MPNWCAPACRPPIRKPLTEATLHGWAAGDANFSSRYKKPRRARVLKSEARASAVVPDLRLTSG